MELTKCDDIAKERLNMILANNILRFNPYRVTDDALIQCVERGYWQTWPSITQMMILHFQDIRLVHAEAIYYGLFFKVGNTSETFHFGINTFSRPMTHLVTKQPVWMTLNGKHVTPSTIDKLVNRDVFVSHAINCRKPSGKLIPSYRMCLLYGSEHKRASIIRQSMIASKIAMLEEVMQYPSHPYYLGYTGNSFDYRTPIVSAIEQIRKYPDAMPPDAHPL